MNISTMLFSFEGRINRKPFWLLLLGLTTGYVLARIIDMSMEPYSDVVSGIYLLVTTWPIFALHAKRWHDRDKSGWWVLIGIIPIIGWGIVLVNGCITGTEGTNRFGADPLKDGGETS